MAIYLQNNPVDKKKPTPPYQISQYQNLEGLVCGSKEEDPRDVVLFGDQAIFTFSIALASLRANGSSGMTAACYKQNLINPSKYGPLTTVPDFNERKRECVEWCITNGGHNFLRLTDKAKFTNIKEALSVPDFSLTWQNDIDTLKLEIPLDLVVTGKVVWLQCPWVPGPSLAGSGPYDEVNGSSGTSRLIQDFMTAMKDKQKAGDYLLIGIINDRKYMEFYYLVEILGEVPGDKIMFGYRFQGEDTELIKKILGCGYKHEAYEKDIHRIFRDHTTLVFKREGTLAGMIGRTDIINDPLITQVTIKEVVVLLSQRKGFYTGRVVWYQLPPSSDVKMEQIKSFMRNIGKKQGKGDYLLIGTTTSSQFTDLKIEEMIGDGDEGHAYNGYKFIRIDVKLINMLTARGYKHGSTDAKVLVYKKAGRGAKRKGMTPKPKAK